MGTPAEEADISLCTLALSISQKFSDREFNKIQLRKMRNFLVEAKKSPFYNKLFSEAGVSTWPGEKLSDMQYIPIVSRAILNRLAKSEWLNPEIPELLRGHIVSTSGSTGNPLSFYFAKQSGIRMRAQFRYMLDYFSQTVDALKQPVRVFNLGIKTWVYPWLMVVSGQDLENNEGRTRLYSLLNETHPDILFTTATYLRQLSYWMRRDKSFYQFKFIVYTAEPLSQADRSFFVRFFKCDLFSMYGIRECGLLAIECVKTRKFHLIREWGYLEIVDELGHPIPEGNFGDIVYSFYENIVNPFVRYKIGDRGRLLKTNGCPCGNVAPYLEFSGRTSEFLVSASGKLIPCLHLSHLISESLSDEIHQVQFIQINPGKLIIRAVFKNPNKPDVAEKLFRVVKKYLQKEFVIKLEKVMEIVPLSSGKTPLLVKK